VRPNFAAAFWDVQSRLDAAPLAVAEEVGSASQAEACFARECAVQCDADQAYELAIRV
jgi:hypothetical protein